jgi:hypothetical protein
VGNEERGNLTIFLPGGGERAIAGDILNSLEYRLAFSDSRGEQVSAAVPPGKSSLTLNLALGDWTVHADAFLESGAIFGSGEASFRVLGGRTNSVNIDMSSFFLTSIDAVNAALDSPSPVNPIPSDPIPLAVSLDLADASEGWAALLTAIQNGSTYVALDLSACTMGSGVTEFDPQPGPSDAGESWIVSLVLPNGATSIAADPTYGDNPTFRHFSALKSIVGGAVATIGGSAFYGCTGLTSVDLPAVTTIGMYAFRGCSGLGSVSFPIAADIGMLAFNNCTGLGSVSLPVASIISGGTFDGCSALSSVNLPAAVTIDGNAFYGCGSLISVSLPFVSTIGNYAFEACSGLTTVSLPKATDIGSNAFHGCTGLTTVSLPSADTFGNSVFQATGTGPLTVTLGGTVPELGDLLFYNVTAARNVTVQVPGNAAWSDIISGSPYSGNDTTENWGNGFRGGGWAGTAMMNSAYINISIKLTIEEIPAP